MVRVLLLLLVMGSVLIGWANSHQESGDWSCESDSGIRVQAQFKPGIITLDGHADDWKDIDGFEFSLLPALDPDDDKEYKDGKMTVKALHDGRDVFFLLQVDGKYVYTKGNKNKCPSVALMFPIGDHATYHDMGGCKEGTSTCTSKSCKGHEVDIMHFSIGNAIPGRLYGENLIDNGEGNGGDRFGHLVDLYAWNPHCRYIDGVGPSGISNIKLCCPFLMGNETYLYDEKTMGLHLKKKNKVGQGTKQSDKEHHVHDVLLESQSLPFLILSNAL